MAGSGAARAAPAHAAAAAMLLAASWRRLLLPPLACLPQPPSVSQPSSVAATTREGALPQSANLLLRVQVQSLQTENHIVAGQNLVSSQK